MENMETQLRMIIQGPYLRPKQASEYLNLPISTLYDFVAKGLLPKPIKLGARASVFSRPALDAALAERAKPTVE